MIVSQLCGGLGNQMFQYAAGRAIALRLNEPMVVDVSLFKKNTLHQGYELSRVFKMDASLADPRDVSIILGWQRFRYARGLMRWPIFQWLRKDSFVLEPSFSFWSGIYAVSGDCYLSGYWQSERYFSSYADSIRSDFDFKQPLDSANAYTLDRILRSNSVSLHVRRGDYISAENKAVYARCSLEYYREAVAYISTRVENPVFFIFSDDLAWAESNLSLGYPCVYVSHNKGAESYNDMRLMSKCNHHVIANSTFSWWGAWLNPSPSKIVVAPRAWFVNGTDERDLCPEAWVRL